MGLVQRMRRDYTVGALALTGLLAAPIVAWSADASTAAATPAPNPFLVPASALMVVLQLGVLILAARLGGLLFRRWRLPSMLGELSAGIVIGPHVLGGLIVPEALFGGVPAAAVAGANGLFGVVALALMALVFLVGLETDARLMRPSARLGALAVGVGGTGAALLAGCAAIVLLGPRLLDTAPAAWWTPGTLLAGVAVAVASFGGVARILTREHRMESPEGGVALSAATVDSALAIVLVTVAAGLARAGADSQPPALQFGAQVLIKTLAVGLAVGAVAFLVARQVNRWLGPAREGVGPAVYGLGLALLAGGVCVCLGVSPLLGAYVMGLAFAATDIRHLMQDRLEVVHAALVPACFALVGTQVDPALLARPGVLLFALLFAAAVLLAKAVGAGALARLAGMNATGCLRVGASLLPRGELTPAVALVALSLGALPAGLLAAVVTLFAASGLLAPVLARPAFARGGAGTRRGFPATESLRLVFAFPSPNAAGLVLDRLIELFEDEGFYVNLFRRRARFYQLLRGASVLGVQCAGAEIVFTCLADDRDLVNTAMVEVGASMEQCLRELRAPLDAGALRKRLLDEARQAGARPPAGAALRSYLTPATLRPRLLADDKAGVIAELLDLLAAQGLLRDREAATAAVLEREQSLPTGLENGIAIPHGRTDAVDRLVCAVGLKPAGVDFEATDGRPARIVFLVLAPQHAAAPQLQFISGVCQMMDARGRAALLSCDTPEEMHAVLTGSPAAHAPRRHRQPALSGLAWQSVALDLHAANKAEALDQLLALCARSGAVLSPDEARRDLFAREQTSSTGLEDGLALPHARTAAVNRPVCAFGISRAGVAFDAMDGQPVHFFGMVLLPPSATTEYTRIIAVLARALDAEGRQALLAAHSSHEVLAILAARGGEGD